MTPPETALAFECAGSTLVGVIHPAAETARRGVLIVVGGPQYRVGSHRQFVLIARALAAAGIPAMRFDYRGIGDSDGPFRGFEDVGDDIAAAIGAFLAHVPGLEEVVLWGLCDAASAIMFYAHRDPRVAAMVVLNPWVRTDAGEAKTYLKHYYRRRLADPDFWRKALSGKLEIAASLRSLLSLASRAVGASERSSGRRQSPLPVRMAEGLGRYRGPVLLVLCGNDLTAREFEEAAKASPAWQQALSSDRIERCGLPEADHTFSARHWRAEVIGWTIDILARLGFQAEAGAEQRGPARSRVAAS